jgi:uncharacterized membrane protein YkvA (DUF1232 family)
MKNTGEKNLERDIMAEFTAAEGAADTGNESGRRRVVEGFSAWVASVKNINLAAKANTLWKYLHDKRTPAANKTVIVAALLYCIVPTDLMPDFIPVSGFLDDLAIVLSVLAYVDAKVITDKVVDVDTTTGTTDNDRASGKNPNEIML